MLPKVPVQVWPNIGDGTAWADAGPAHQSNGVASTATMVGRMSSSFARVA
jgi:hypothetical protein